MAETMDPLATHVNEASLTPSLMNKLRMRFGGGSTTPRSIDGKNILNYL